TWATMLSCLSSTVTWKMMGKKKHWLWPRAKRLWRMLDRNLTRISQVTRTTIPTTRSKSYGTTKCFAEANHTAIGVSRRFSHVTSGSSGLVDSSSAAVLWHEPIWDLGIDEFSHLRCRWHAGNYLWLGIFHLRADRRGGGHFQHDFGAAVGSHLQLHRGSFRWARTWPAGCFQVREGR